jgi:hypothetical protein
MRIIRHAARGIRKLADQIELGENERVAAELRRVAERIPRSLELERGFGVKVEELMKTHHLADPQVIEKFVESSGFGQGRNWSSALSYYRGMVMHSGYLDIEGDPRAARDVSILIDHLHDVLIRIMLKMLDYPGPYQPSTIGLTVDYPIDWVTAETLPRRLGYE